MVRGAGGCRVKAPNPIGAVLLIWGVLALANLSAGLVLASRPDRASDLETMHRWGKAWLVDGRTLYGDEDEFPDYPPHGLVALAPLGLLPANWLVPVWASVNLALAVLTPYLAVRAFDPTIKLATAAVPILMFLCWTLPHTPAIQPAHVCVRPARGGAGGQAADGCRCLSGARAGEAGAGGALFCWTLFTRRAWVATGRRAVPPASRSLCARTRARSPSPTTGASIPALYTGTPS